MSSNISKQIIVNVPKWGWYKYFPVFSQSEPNGILLEIIVNIFEFNRNDNTIK